MSKLLWLVYSIVLFLFFSSAFYLSKTQKQHQVNELQIIEIEKQIALDLPLLDLSNELLKHSGNKAAITYYIKKLNTFIISSGIQVINIEPKHEFNSSLKPSQFIRKLNSNNGPIFIVFSLKQPYFTAAVVTFHGLLFILSVLCVYLFNQAYFKQSAKVASIHAGSQQPEPNAFLLTIDLNSKTLTSNFSSQKQTALANKPLCFYLALVEYCTNNSDIKLNHNKDVPQELIELANKYFQRLVELGHTVRKRPNFNNSLEKTLSEIRAALDDVLCNVPEEKELYYPPKAFGEGSRSKLHSYGLVNIAKGNIEIVGK